MIVKGDVGTPVAELQSKLNKYFNKPVLKIDGEFGGQTDLFVKRFQAEKGLVADGIVGPLTATALDEKTGGPISIPVTPPPANQSAHYPPFANVMKEKMAVRGTYAKGYPYGAVVHFTAGRDGAKKTIMHAIEAESNKQYTYWCIQKDGKLFCAHPVEKWGWHAGSGRWSKYVPYLKDSLNDDCIGIEINNSGNVKPISGKPGKFITWFKEEIDAKDVRYVDGKSKDQCKGYYEKYTAAQEETLVLTLLWLKAQRPDVFKFDAVVGHSEISGVLGVGTWRKTDPSGALSCTMPELRRRLVELYKLKEQGTSDASIIEAWKRYAT